MGANQLGAVCQVGDAEKKGGVEAATVSRCLEREAAAEDRVEDGAAEESGRQGAGRSFRTLPN